MSGAGSLAIALGCVFAVNLLPAFGPPTWAVLVFWRAVLQKRQRLAPKGSRKPTPNAVTSVKR